MAGFIQAGYIAKPGEDIFPTTGPHLDVRVKKGGQYIDPATWRSGLQNLLVGEQKTPLYSQTKDGFTPGFTITSPFGNRKAPVAGASTFHRGIDFGIPGGTPLYWKGAGSFKPGKGLGTIQTPEGYEVELLHTKGGKEASLAANQQTAQVPAAPPQQPASVDSPQSINIVIDSSLFGKEKEKEDTAEDFLKKYAEEKLATKPSNIMGNIGQFLMNMPRQNYFA